MTYEQYWYGDVGMTRAFVEADRLRQERANDEMWLQGMYIYDLLSRLCPLPITWVDAKKMRQTPYMEKPYEIRKNREKQEAEPSPEEIAKKKAQVRGLQAKLFTRP